MLGEKPVSVDEQIVFLSSGDTARAANSDALMSSFFAEEMRCATPLSG
jgi:hypothetical protein